MRKKAASSSRVDFQGWKSISYFKELELPNKIRCSHGCCEGVYRTVKIKISNSDQSKTKGLVIHFNSRRIIVDLADNKGEIIVTKAMIGSVEMWVDDAEERKMKAEVALQSLERPSILSEKNIKETKILQGVRREIYENYEFNDEEF